MNTQLQRKEAARKKQEKNRVPQKQEKIGGWPSTRAILCGALLQWHTKSVPPILHQESWTVRKSTWRMPLDYAPRVRTLAVSPRLKDYMGRILKGKIKCGSFWNKYLGAPRGYSARSAK